MKKIKLALIYIISVVLLLSSLPINGYAQEGTGSGTLKITTTPAGADVYIDGERYIQKCTPCTIALEKGSYEIKLSIKGDEEYTTTVQIATGEETKLESKILPEIPNSDAKVITVTTEDDSEEDFNNTSVTYDDLESMEKVSLRMAANVINNDATDCWYRIEFAEGVNHIEPVNHTIEFTRGNLIINGDKDRNGTPDVWITQTDWGIAFLPMDNLYIMGLKLGGSDTTDCALSIRPNDFFKIRGLYDNL